MVPNLFQYHFFPGILIFFIEQPDYNCRTFNEFRGFIYSRIFSTISPSLELSSLIMNAVYIEQDESSANSLVDGKVNILSVCTLFGWYFLFCKHEATFFDAVPF